MKLNTQKRSIEAGGGQVNVGFTIDMNAKAFNVLSDGMYENGITSVVRELSSNAWDSHVAAGTPELPFEVSCPNAFDPYFAVKDFGTGLRYFKYTAKVVNEHDGESTLFIDGDIRQDIDRIGLCVLNEFDTFAPSAILYDKTEDKTVIRIAGNFEGEMVVEFDDALVLYSTYFRSTKDDSDDFVGAFGLGSKTPFAVTDNFQVTNIFNGTMSVYNIYIDEDGRPQIKIFGRAETDEPNGLEVKMGIDPDDFVEFKEAISEELKCFDPAPVIMNEPVTMPEVVYRGEHFIVFDDQVGGFHELTLSLGNNSYDVGDWSITNSVNTIFRTNVVLRFDIGELQPTSNRESLRLDGDAHDLIRERGEQAVEEYRDYILDTVKDADMDEHERIEFALKHRNVIPVSDPVMKEFIGNPDLHYGTHEVYVPIRWGVYNEVDFFEVEDEKGVMVTRVGRGQRREPLDLHMMSDSTMKRRERFNADKIPYGEGVRLFIKDTSHAFMKKIRHYVREEGINPSVTRLLIVPEPKTDIERDAIESMRIMVRDFESINISDIELPKNTSISTSATSDYKTPVGRMMPEGWNIDSNINQWDEVYTPLTKIEQDEDMFIVEMFRNEIQNGEDFTWVDTKFLSVMRKDGALDGVTIIALSTAKYEKALTYGFQPISKLVERLKEDVVVDNGFRNEDMFRNTVNDNEFGVTPLLTRISDLDTFFCEEIEAPEAVEHVRKVYRVLSKRYEPVCYNSSRWDRDRTIADLLELELDPNPDFVEALDNFAEMCDNVFEVLKVLDHVNTNWMKPELKKDLLEFINWKLTNTGANDE